MCVFDGRWIFTCFTFCQSCWLVGSLAIVYVARLHFTSSSFMYEHNLMHDHHLRAAEFKMTQLTVCKRSIGFVQ